MGLWQRVREGLRRPASPPGKGVEVVARLLPSWLTNKPLPHPHDYAKFAEEGALLTDLVRFATGGSR